MANFITNALNIPKKNQGESMSSHKQWKHLKESPERSFVLKESHR